MQQSKRVWRSYWLMAAMVTLLAVITVACSSGNNGAGGETGGTDMPSGESSDAPYEFEIMLGFSGVEFPRPGNDAQNMIEEYTNTKLHFRASPDAALHDMLPAIIASGDMPEVMAFGGSQLSQSYMIDAFQTDVFWDISPFLEQFPNLNSINPVVFENYMVDGKIFGLPKVRPLARGAFTYRKDWLDALGMSEPETIEDFYEMVRAFAQDDPTGTGQRTYGLTRGNAVGGFGVIFGAPNGWKVEDDGSFTRAELTEEYMESLKFERQMFEEGIYHPEFILFDRSRYEGLFTEGNAGVYHNVTSVAVNALHDASIKEHTPDAELAMFSLLEGPNGTFIDAGRGHNGIMVFPRSSVQTEEELLKILDFFDKLAEPEMANLLSWGIEGVHHEVNDEGKASFLSEEAEAQFHSQISTPFTGPMASLLTGPLAMEPAEQSYFHNMEIELNEMNEEHAVINPSYGLISETHSQIGTDLNLILSDAATKFVMGSIEEEEYWSETERWKRDGGDRIAQEFADSYRERQEGME